MQGVTVIPGRLGQLVVLPVDKGPRPRQGNVRALVLIDSAYQQSPGDVMDPVKAVCSISLVLLKVRGGLKKDGCLKRSWNFYLGFISNFILLIVFED